MTELLTAAQMRAIEAAAIESGTITGLELMERAGHGVVEAIFEEWPELRASSYRVVVLCGPGNNGGDGFVVARLLKEWGWTVEVFLYGDPAKLPPDARVNYERWTGLGETHPWAFAQIIEAQADVYIDAVFGAGLRAEPDAAVMSVHTELYTTGRTFGRLVAIDSPTGLCMNSGRDMCRGWGAFYAFLTVTFHAARIGHFSADGEEFCGKIVIKDIGLGKRPAGVLAADATVALLGADLAGAAKLWLGKHAGGHKFSHGYALVLSGGIASGGAARLAARGALRIGAGVVTLGCPPSAVTTNAAHLNAIMLKPVADGAALEAILQDTRINALCLGPGMGTTAKQAELLAVALGQGGGERRPVVLDADALTLLAGDEALFGLLHDRCILTPHAGEFARLFPDIAAKLDEPATKGPAFSRVDATREAAKRAGCVVLFKGPDTVIAAPDGHCSINAALYNRAAPWLATAGSGDVLAGFITGLLARGFAPMQAAETGAWLHLECALSFGPGLIAEDLPEALPKVFRALGL